MDATSDRAEVTKLARKMTKKYRPIVTKWFELVRHDLLSWMEEPRMRVHSVRARIKDPSHVVSSIMRRIEKGASVAQENFFEELQDLAGVRVLVLYRHDMAIVDHFIYRNTNWRVLSARANYDETRDEDRKLFRDLGFEEGPNATGTKRLVPDPSGYASIHYILVRRNLSDDKALRDPEKCELQVRTIHEEAWGEFSHEFVYPKDRVDPLASKLIRRLSGLLHQAEDIVSDIRRSPADGRLFRMVHSELWEGSTELPPDLTFNVIHKMLSEFHFLSRSAPLAVVGILTDRTERVGLDARDLGTSITGDRIVSLGFGDPADWAGEESHEIQKLYLMAHSKWKKNAGVQRSVSKFFVWFLDRTERNRSSADGEGTVPDLFFDPKCNHGLNFFRINEHVFEELHRILESDYGLGCDGKCGYSLYPMQFFLWEPKCMAKLPGDWSPEVTGFYSPSPDSDLLAGVLWLTETEDRGFTGDPDMHLRSYAALLEAMCGYERFAWRITKKRQQPCKKDLTDDEIVLLKSLVADHFGKADSAGSAC